MGYKYGQSPNSLNIKFQLKGFSLSRNKIAGYEENMSSRVLWVANCYRRVETLIFDDLILDVNRDEVSLLIVHIAIPLTMFGL